MLKKRIRGLASRFNATDFGYDPEVGERIAACYGRRFAIQPHRLAMPHHSLIRYALDNVFPQMVAAAGIAP